MSPEISLETQSDIIIRKMHFKRISVFQQPKRTKAKAKEGMKD